MAGAFTVNVVPTDAFGNPSMKIENTVGSERIASVAVTFSFQQCRGDGALRSADHSGIGGADFGAVAADVGGSATITVSTVVDTYNRRCASSDAR